VKRLTSDPAALYGLADRGVLAPGMRADVNILDFENLGIERPEMVFDLPAGAGRMIQRSTGYIATVVAGESVVENGEITGALPGGLVRGPQTADAG